MKNNGVGGGDAFDDDADGVFGGAFDDDPDEADDPDGCDGFGGPGFGGERAGPGDVDESESRSPFALNDCDRIELDLAARRREKLLLDPRLVAEAEWIDENIERCGYSVWAVGTGRCSHPDCDGGDGDAPWSYTVGRAFFGTPELVTTGLDAQSATRVTNLVGVRAPWRFESGLVFEFGPLRARLDPVGSAWLFMDLQRMAAWFWAFQPFHERAARTPDIWQVVWSDAEGHFPDDPRCHPGTVAAQPLLAVDPFSYPPVDLDAEWHDLIAGNE